jgi:uncharacterized protein
MRDYTKILPEKVIRGLELYNQGAFYQAHEYFEDAWRETPDKSREFFRALLHMSGGFFRLTQDRPTAAKKFFNHALRWLGEFSSPYLGFDIHALSIELESLIKTIDQNKKAGSILKEHFLPIYPKNHLEDS